MARTKGSGWGTGYPILWQKCPLCGKKKAYYKWFGGLNYHKFYCTSCKETFDSEELITQNYKM